MMPAESPDKDCPECRGAGYTNTQSADRGNHTYKFDCLICWGTGRVKKPSK